MSRHCISLFLSSVFIAAAILGPQAAPSEPAPAQYMKYKGAWFSVEYPRGWKVHLSPRSTTSVTGSDSARFISTDGSTEFYVFSPQWNGNPKEVRFDPTREFLVSHRTQRASRVKMTSGDYLSNPLVNWYTVRAKDNSYQRSWVDTEDKGLNVRRVFGIRYRNRQAYKRYKPQYDHFRRSLEQFSD